MAVVSWLAALAPQPPGPDVRWLRCEERQRRATPVVEVRGAQATSHETTCRRLRPLRSPGFDSPVATSQARSRGSLNLRSPTQRARTSRAAARSPGCIEHVLVATIIHGRSAGVRRRRGRVGRWGADRRRAGGDGRAVHRGGREDHSPRRHVGVLRWRLLAARQHRAAARGPARLHRRRPRLPHRDPRRPRPGAARGLPGPRARARRRPRAAPADGLRVAAVLGVLRRARPGAVRALDPAGRDHARPAAARGGRASCARRSSATAPASTGGAPSAAVSP